MNYSLLTPAVQFNSVLGLRHHKPINYPLFVTFYYRNFIREEVLTHTLKLVFSIICYIRLVVAYFTFAEHTCSRELPV